jgi:cytidylate kinase
MRLSYYPIISKLLSSMNLGDVFSFASQNESLFVKPYVTIARQPGTGGRLIAELVAKKLSFDFLNKEIVEDIAQSTKKRSAIIKSIDENGRSVINDVVHALFNEEYIDDYTYIKELSKVMLAYMLKGRVVLLGRAGNFISPACRGLHVDIVAPMKTKIANTVKFEGLEPAKAKARIQKITSEREKFTTQYFKKDVWNPQYYDLTINTVCLSNEAAANMIVEAFYQKFPAKERYGTLFQK